jgi:hypothetical protein
MPRRSLRWIVLFAGLTACRQQDADLSAACLEMYPGLSKCCTGTTRPDNGICCPFGMHAVSDIDHPDWKACVPDEQPHTDAGVCPAANTGIEADAGADAP